MTYNIRVHCEFLDMLRQRRRRYPPHFHEGVLEQTQVQMFKDMTSARFVKSGIDQTTRLEGGIFAVCTDQSEELFGETIHLMELIKTS